MTKVTILGAGITAMAVAATLPKHYDITILARNLPGDPDSQEWASPWAGAVWMGMADSSPAEQKMQLEAFAYLWRLALRHPESSVRRIEMLDLMDFIPLEKVWYRYKMPGFRVLTKEEMPPDAPFGVTYGSVVLTPMIFLPWLRKRLEANGVKFLRANVTSLSQLKDMGHNILINATGVGAKYLQDVKDQQMQEVRGQTVLVKSDFDKIWIRRGKDYTYCLPRLDGTAILGGIKQFGATEKKVDGDLRADIFRRIHEGIPQAFPSPHSKDFAVVRDIVGIRPQRSGGARIEKEVIDGQKVVHAYGAEGGGYIFSWGLAREVTKLVSEYEFESPEPPNPLAAKL
ncbi:Nucleotide-binding domain-containing protein [Pleurostoma richardsiae]|uniref:Nucleotide-binding domain-containing protein n=1 Tax=Pleurostoma richardsiae TaxID=41990 RepID=A0AA38VHI0_9PEZI|nr:Nucleotide-binding domain-containing protein [Pleurostoma richardsiae]